LAPALHQVVNYTNSVLVFLYFCHGRQLCVRIYFQVDSRLSLCTFCPGFWSRNCCVCWIHGIAASFSRIAAGSRLSSFVRWELVVRDLWHFGREQSAWWSGVLTWNSWPVPRSWRTGRWRADGPCDVVGGMELGEGRREASVYTVTVPGRRGRKTTRRDVDGCFSWRRSEAETAVAAAGARSPNSEWCSSGAGCCTLLSAAGIRPTLTAGCWSVGLCSS